MEAITVVELLEAAAEAGYLPEPEPGQHTLFVESVTTRGTRKYMTAVTDSGGRCKIPLGEERKQRRVLRLLLGYVPADVGAELIGKKFRVRLRRSEYQGTTYWEVTR
jgi:hypothetical protein